MNVKKLKHIEEFEIDYIDNHKEYTNSNRISQFLLHWKHYDEPEWISIKHIQAEEAIANYLSSDAYLHNTAEYEKQRVERKIKKIASF